jgi:hypothetical protein
VTPTVHTQISTARARFITAARRIINLLRLRRLWAAYGRVLKQKPRTLLFEGLERRKGKLIRKFPGISVWDGKSK